MTEVVIAKGKRFRDSLMAAKVKIVGAGATGLVLFGGYASAAVNFTPIKDLITATIDLIPSFFDLVIQVAPIIVLVSILGFVVKFWDRILNMLNIN